VALSQLHLIQLGTLVATFRPPARYKVVMRSSSKLVILATVGLAPTSALAQTPPTFALRGTPVLYVATPQSGKPDTPVAWVTFRTQEPTDSRKTVVRVHGMSGRTFGGRSTPCLRSTVVTDDGRSPLHAGNRYVVSFYARAGIGQSRPRTLVATRTLSAHAFRSTGRGRSAPSC